MGSYRSVDNVDGKNSRQYPGEKTEPDITFSRTHSTAFRLCVSSLPADVFERRPRGGSDEDAQMSERDVEKSVSKERFIETLRRVADSLEKGESFRIQIQNERITVPVNCELSFEHERDEETEEIELQFRWPTKGS